MPRKKSTSGRARTATSESKLILTLDKVNRKLHQLDINQVYGKYSAKKMLQIVQRESNNIKYNKQKKEQIRVNVKKLTASQIRYYQKVFDSFLKSKTSTLIGIKEVRTKTEQKLKQSLGELVDKEITDQDIDDFYSIVADDDFRYIADKIGDSLEYILIDQMKAMNGSEEDLIKLLSQFMTVNSEEIRQKASRLYNKYIKG